MADGDDAIREGRGDENLPWEEYVVQLQVSEDRMAEGAPGAATSMDERLSLAAQVRRTEQLGDLAENRPDLIPLVMADAHRHENGSGILDRDVGDGETTGRRRVLSLLGDDPERSDALARDPVRGWDAAARAVPEAQERLSQAFRDGDEQEIRRCQHDVHLLDAWKRERAGEIAGSAAQLVRFGRLGEDKSLRLLEDAGHGTDRARFRESGEKAGRYLDSLAVASDRMEKEGLSGDAGSARAWRMARALDVSRDRAAMLALGSASRNVPGPVATVFVSDVATGRRAVGRETEGTEDTDRRRMEAAERRLGEIFSREAADGRRDLNDPAGKYAAIQDVVARSERSPRGRGEDLDAFRMLGAVVAKGMRDEHADRLPDLFRNRPDLKEQWNRDVMDRMRDEIGRAEREIQDDRERTVRHGESPSEGGEERGGDASSGTDSSGDAARSGADASGDADPGSGERSVNPEGRVRRAFRRSRNEPRNDPRRINAEEVKEIDRIWGASNVSNVRELGRFFNEGPEERSLALPLNAFGGANGNIRKKLEWVDTETVKKMYENTLAARKKVAGFNITNSTTRAGEDARNVHDQFEMGRRAVAREMARRGTNKDPETMANEAAQFRSRKGMELPEGLRRDPGGAIRDDDVDRRVKVLKSFASKVQSGAKRIGEGVRNTGEGVKNSGRENMKRGASRLVGTVNQAIDQVM